MMMKRADALAPYPYSTLPTAPVEGTAACCYCCSVHRCQQRLLPSPLKPPHQISEVCRSDGGSSSKKHQNKVKKPAEVLARRPVASNDRYVLCCGSASITSLFILFAGPLLLLLLLLPVPTPACVCKEKLQE